MQDYFILNVIPTAPLIINISIIVFKPDPDLKPYFAIIDSPCSSSFSFELVIAKLGSIDDSIGVNAIL